MRRGRLLPSFVLGRGRSFSVEAAPGVAAFDPSVAVAVEGTMAVGDALGFCHAVADPILTLSCPQAGPLVST